MPSAPRSWGAGVEAVPRDHVARLDVRELAAERRPREPPGGDPYATAARSPVSSASHGPGQANSLASPIGTSPSPRVASQTRHAVHGSGWSAGGAGTSAVSSSRIAARQAATERLNGGRSSGGRSAVRTPGTLSPRDQAGRRRVGVERAVRIDDPAFGGRDSAADMDRPRFRGDALLAAADRANELHVEIDGRVEIARAQRRVDRAADGAVEQCRKNPAVNSAERAQISGPGSSAKAARPSENATGSCRA